MSDQEKISALFLCADILDYPDDDYIKNIKILENLTKITCNSQEIVLDRVQSEFIRVFSMSSTGLRCVPYASWWLDGKMSGKSLSKILDFYKWCGYEFDTGMMKKPADNLSSMISFIAILAKDKKTKEIEEFTKFLTWIDDFANSLDLATEIKYFKYAVDISTNIISSLKERL